MKPYLKYYFFLDNDQLKLDSIVSTEEVPTTIRFVKWYEEGDFVKEPLPKELREEIAKTADSPLFVAMFAPKRIAFKVEDYIK